MDNSDIKSEFHQLLSVLTYLGQDYTIFGETLEDAVSAYIDDADPEVIEEARREIVKFLDCKANDLDAELERLSDDDCSRYPGMSARDYLLWLDNLLSVGLVRKTG